MRLTGLGGSRLQCPHLSTHRAFKDRAPTQPKKKQFATLPLSLQLISLLPLPLPL